MNKSNRVLTRVGARELTVEEMELVDGAVFNTLVCTAAFKTTTRTGLGDGDGCSDSDHS
jgi:hypothetical protein